MQLHRLGVVFTLASAGSSCTSTHPPEDPVLFGPNRISTEGREFATAFSADGRTVFFNTIEDGNVIIRAATFESGEWSAHQALPFSDGTHSDVDPFVAAAGCGAPDERVIFSSSRGSASGDDYDLWSAHRTSEGWADPVRLPSPPNGPDDEIFASLTASGTIYFSVRIGDAPREIFRCRFENERYLPRERIELDIDPDASIGNPLIAPDESFLIFTSRDLGGEGGVDLIWTDRSADGKWSTPRPLPAPINSEFADFAPGFGPDARTLYFTSERPGIVGAGEVEGRPPGDLYVVDLNALLR